LVEARFFSSIADFVCPDPLRREQNQGVHGFIVFKKYNVLRVSRLCGFYYVFFLILTPTLSKGEGAMPHRVLWEIVFWFSLGFVWLL
jgi:hypothetical protein